jgi:hypothetical protein
MRFKNTGRLENSLGIRQVISVYKALGSISRIKEEKKAGSMVAYACNPSCLGDRQENHSWRPAQTKLVRPFSKKRFFIKWNKMVQPLHR